MLELLHTPLTVLHVFACLFLMLVVLLQPGKGGGLGAFTGQAATQVFGGRGASNLLTKTTWVTATIFFVTSVTLAYLSTSSDTSLEKRAHAAEQAEQSKPKDVGATPTPAPAPAPASSK